MDTEEPERIAPPGGGPSLAAAHTRFGRAALSIYLGTAAVAAALLVTALVADLGDQKQDERRRLSLETQLRAQYLTRHLHLLAGELTRLGLRSEVNLVDANPEPERDLLRLTHERSAFFDVGVAILDETGSLVWAEPPTFLENGPLANTPLFAAVRRERSLQVFSATQLGRPGSVVYLATPVERGGRFEGAFVGALDVASPRNLGPGSRVSRSAAETVLVTREGEVAYPWPAPPETRDPSWAQIVREAAASSPSVESFVTEARLGALPTVVTAAPVEGTDFLLMTRVDAARLYASARNRLLWRLTLGVVLFAAPLLLLTQRLRASLKAFRSAESDAVREENLKSLGKAVNLIAHEVKNSLNSIRVGLDLVLRGDRRSVDTSQRVVDSLRSEIARLSDFATELLSFSKGVSLRRAHLDLAEFVPKVVELSRPMAASRQISLEVATGGGSVPVRADPSLVHVALANLVGNALDFAGDAADGHPRVGVKIEPDGGMARIVVADNGPGVNPAILPRLFEPFVAGRPNGVGIGLALSRAIARAHGGDVVLQAGGVETVFVLSLPKESR